ncbi:MAG: TonB family protein [Burkholderiaceae bacterium]|nr:TonB family protein [Burkholderiaceae bacterium]
MRAVAGLPGHHGASHRTSPLALAVLLHGALLLALMQGLSPSHPRLEPREVVIALVAPRTETPQARPLTPPAPAAMAPQQALSPPQLEPQPQPRPLPVSEPLPAPVLQDTPSPVTSTPVASAPMPAPMPAASATAATPPVQESRPAPAAPVMQQAPAAGADRGPVTVSSVEYLQPPKPDYPLGAKRAGEQGKVVLRILISDKGLPERVDIKQSAGFPRLDEAARAAALRAVFKPHLEDGRAVPAYVLVPINFALK